jgi:NAD(P)-dependent dehydrogenase (short-subunit alcohol dehydrogenase family)
MSDDLPRRAVVIGGASGIGWASAHALAARGEQVTLADRNADGARHRAGELGAPHTAAEVDVTDEASVERLFETTGAVDVVVNCAGFSNIALITEMPVDQFRDVVDVCLTGALIVAKHAGRTLRPNGVLISISSLNARQPAAGMSAYCAAKAALSMLTQVAALEFGPRGLRVNAIAPGLVTTPLTEAITLVPGAFEDYVDNTALGRAGTPEDIAGAVLYLSSPEASWLTGEVLDLNGGAHLKRYPDVMAHVTKLMQSQ